MKDNKTPCEVVRLGSIVALEKFQLKVVLMLKRSLVPFFCNILPSAFPALRVLFGCLIYMYMLSIPPPPLPPPPLNHRIFFRLVRLASSSHASVIWEVGQSLPRYSSPFLFSIIIWSSDYSYRFFSASLYLVASPSFLLVNIL